MGKFQIFSLSIFVVKSESNGRTFSEFSDTDEVDLVVGLDAIVVSRVGEVERKHTLLLEVGLVDTSERTSDDSSSSEETGLESGVFTGRSLTVVLSERESEERDGVGQIQLQFETEGTKRDFELTSSPMTTHPIPWSRY